MAFLPSENRFSGIRLDKSRPIGDYGKVNLFGIFSLWLSVIRSAEFFIAIGRASGPGEEIMSNVCEYCGKKTTFGIKYARRGAAKSKGGSGAKISGKSKRPFKPNLQNVRAEVEGRVKRIRVCTSCLSAGKVKKAARGQLKLRKALAS